MQARERGRESTMTPASVTCCREAPGCWATGKTFHDLFQEAAACTLSETSEMLQPKSAWPEFPYKHLDKRYTYLFELCHPEVCQLQPDVE